MDMETGGLAMSPGDSNENGNGNGAGIITAGEWNDLDNWDFWKALLAGQNQEQEQQAEVYGKHLEYWEFSTDIRIPVTITDNQDNPVCGAKVALYRDNESQPIWTAVSDNKGSAELWDRFLTGAYATEVHSYSISVNGSITDSLLLRCCS